MNRIVLLGCLALPGALNAQVRVVGPGADYPTITAALDAARPGDTVRIRPGTYREPELVIRRPVTLQGEGGPEIRGGAHTTLTILADRVTVEGLTFVGGEPSTTEDRAAIHALGARACRIRDNEFRATVFGIYLARVTGCVVSDNRFEGAARGEALSGNAIHSWNSRDLVLSGNDLAGHRDGIYFEFTTNAAVRDNHSAGNLRYGLHFMFSDSCSYTGNEFRGNRSGVAVMYSHHVVMRNNRFATSRGGATYGLLLKDITDSRLLENRFSDNSVGLFAEGTARVTVSGNQFESNGWAVQVMANAQETSFDHNRFSNNSFDVSSNSPNAAVRFRRNFWDRYTGYDLDRDGYGDVPYPPVRLFALVVQQNEPAIILMRSFFVSLLDLAERVAPALTPVRLEDPEPLMHWSPR